MHDMDPLTAIRAGSSGIVDMSARAGYGSHGGLPVWLGIPLFIVILAIVLIVKTRRR